MYYGEKKKGEDAADAAARRLLRAEFRKKGRLACRRLFFSLWRETRERRRDFWQTVAETLSGRTDECVVAAGFGKSADRGREK